MSCYAVVDSSATSTSTWNCSGKMKWPHMRRPPPLRGRPPVILFLPRDTPPSPTVVPEWSCSEIIDRAVRQHVRLESDSSFDYFNIHKELHSLAEEALRSLPKGIKKTRHRG